VVLALSAAAFSSAADTYDVQQLGYEAYLTADVSGTNNYGWLYSQITITAAMMAPNNLSTEVYIRVLSEDSDSQQANVQVWVTEGAPVNTQHLPQNDLLNKNGGQLSSDADFVVTTPGTYYVNGLAQCSNCAGDYVYMDVGLLLKYGAAYQPYPVIDSINSMSFGKEFVVQDEFGPCAMLVVTAPINLFTKLSLEYSQAAKNQMVMVYQLGVPINQGDPLPAVSNAEGTVIRYPEAQNIMDGSFSTGPIALSAGTWYMAAYLYTDTTNTKYQDYYMAFGINHEPSGVPALSPRAALLALLAIFCAYVVL